MAGYMFDLALNLNAQSLQINFVTFATKPPSGGSPNLLEVGDTVGFNLFNTTPGATPFTVDNTSSIAFWPVAGAQSASPFANVPPSNTGFWIGLSPPPSPPATGGSVIYGPGPFPVWPLFNGQVVAAGPFRIVVEVHINHFDGGGQGQSFTTLVQQFTVQAE